MPIGGCQHLDKAPQIAIRFALVDNFDIDRQNEFR
jgi:hypothetical protein